MSSSRTPFYSVGGALALSAPSYVQRQADKDLYQWLNEGRFCYVLTTRQMGKTSLMVRTAMRLRGEDVAVVVIDLSNIGSNISAEQWYDGLLLRVGQHLGLQRELVEFWESHSGLGPLDRWMQAIRDVVLERVKGRIIIFVDEIDGVRALPFSTDEFFAGIRSFYNDRARLPELSRLSFCLLGVATPSDLIQDVQTTPFNIGQRIELNDFTQTEAAPLAEGLEKPAKIAPALLERILYWTGGHPYLTQRLCAAVAEEPRATSAKWVDRLCTELFLSARAKEQDSNLIFVRDRILRADADRASLLDLYAQIYAGRKVISHANDPLIDILRISGITREVNGHLRVRNRIYERVFDKRWIAANMPDAELRRQKAAFRRGIIRAASIAAAFLSVIGALALFSLYQSREARRQQQIALEQKRRADASAAEATRALELAKTQAERADEKAEEAKTALAKAQEQKQFADEKAEEARRALANAEEEKRRADKHAEDAKTQFELARKSSEQAKAELSQRISQLSAIYEERGRLEAIRGESRGALPFLSEAASLNETLNRTYGGRRNTATLSFLLARSISQVETERASLKGHASVVGFADFSPDARHVVTAGADGTAKVWEAGSGRLLRSLNKHTDAITGVFFNGGGDRVVTSSLDYTAIVWNISDGSSVVLRGHAGPVTSASFSPRENLVVTTSFDGDAMIWDASSGKQLHRLSDHRGHVLSAAWNGDGTLIVTAGVDKTAKLWDAKKGNLLQTFQGKDGHEKQISAAKFGNAGSTVFTASADGTVKQWDEKTGGLLRTFKDTTAINSFNFSPGRDRMVTAGSDGTAKVWSIPDGQIISTLRGHTGNVNSAVFHRDGAIVLTAGADGSAKIWDAGSGDLLLSLDGHAGEVTFATFNPDGEQVVTTSADNTAKIWDVGGGRLPRSLVHHGQVEAVALSPDDTRIATGGRDGVAMLWDARTGKPIAPPLSHGDEWVLHTAFSRDGSRLLTVSKSQTKIWSADGRPIRTLENGTEQAKPILKSLRLEPSLSKFIIRTVAAAFSPDGAGRYVVTAHEIWNPSGYAEGGYWVEWDTSTGEAVMQSSQSAGRINSVAFHPDGRLIFTVGGNRAIVWRAWNGRQLSTFTRLTCAAITPDGRHVVLGSNNGVANIWSMISNRTRTLQGHGDRIISVAFSADSKRLVTTSADHTAKVWDIESGLLISTLSGHDGNILSADFNREGNLIVTSGGDKTARVWEVETGRLLTTLGGHGNEVRRALFSNDGTRIVTAGPDQTAKLWDVHSEKRTATEIASIVENRVPQGIDYWQLFLQPSDGNWSARGSDAAGRPENEVSEAAHADLRRARLLQEEGRRSALDENWSWAALRLVESYRLGARDASGRYLLWRAARQFEGLDASLKAHTDRTQAVSYSTDGRSILTASIDKTAKLWDAQTGRLRATLTGHTDWIFSAEFSPDGARVVTASRDGTAIIWDAESGKPRHTLAHKMQVSQAIFNADGSRVVTASDDGTAVLWDAFTGKQIRTFGPHSGGVLYVALSVDGERLLTGCRDGSVKLWNTVNGQEVASLEGHKQSITSLAFNNARACFLSASDDGTVKLWAAASGALIRKFDHSTGVNSVAFSRDGQFILMACDDGTVERWSWDGGEPLKLKEHWGVALTAEFSGDDKLIITSGLDRTAKLWDARTGQLLASFEGHPNNITYAAFRPDGKQVATVSGETLRIWKAQPTSLDSRRVDLNGKVLATAVEEKGGRLLALVSRQGLVKVTSVSTGKDVASIKAGASYFVKNTAAGINSLAVLPFFYTDNKGEASQRPDGGKMTEALINSLSQQTGLTLTPYDAVRRYDGPHADAQTAARELGVEAVLTGRIEQLEDTTLGNFSVKLELVKAGGNEPAWSRNHNIYATQPSVIPEMVQDIIDTGQEAVASLSRDGRYVVTGDASGRVGVWDAADGRPVMAFKQSAVAISRVAISDDGRLTAVVGGDNTVVINESMTGKELRRIKIDSPDEITCAEFSPDASLLATSGFDNAARVFRVADGALVAYLQGHKGAVLTARFDRGGTRLVTTSMDKTAKVWDVNGSLLLASLAEHEGGVNAADFSPDASFIVTAAENGTIYLWDAQTGKLLDRLERSDGSVYLARFLPDGGQVVTVSASGTLRVWSLGSADAQQARQIATLVNRFILPVVGREPATQTAASGDLGGNGSPRGRPHK